MGTVVENLRGFDQVRLSTKALITALQKNRETHISEHAEAVEGWIQELGERVNEQADLLNKQEYDEITNFEDLPKPQSYLKQYDKTIRKLEMSLDEEVILSDHEFLQYVMDEWAWKGTHMSNMDSYGIGTRQKRGKR